MNKWRNEWTNEGMIEQAKEQMNERTNEWMNESINQSSSAPRFLYLRQVLSSSKQWQQIRSSMLCQFYIDLIWFSFFLTENL